MISFNPSASLMNPLMQGQINPGRVQDSSVEGAERRNDAYRAQSGGAAGAAMAKLQETLLTRMVERIPGVDIADLQKRDPADFSPEAIAGRIGQFVGRGLENARAQGRSDQEVQSLYDSALSGMERGLAEAKDMLKGLNLLQGKIAEDVDQTAKLTRDALAELDPSRRRELPSLNGTADMSIAERYQSASAFEMTLRTQDGDTVKLRFGQSSESSMSAAAYADSNGNRAAAFSLSRSEQIGFSFEIEGNLSENEMTAIRDLVRDVGRMANDFFAGDVQKAFDQAGRLGFDGSQIASFEVNMSQSQQYTAAQAYRQTQQIETTPEQQRPGLRLGQLMSEMRDRFNQSVLEFLEQPREAGAGIMRALVEQDARMRDSPAGSREQLRTNLEDLLSSVNQPRTEPTGAAAADL